MVFAKQAAEMVGTGTPRIDRRIAAGSRRARSAFAIRVLLLLVVLLLPAFAFAQDDSQNPPPGSPTPVAAPPASADAPADSNAAPATPDAPPASQPAAVPSPAAADLQKIIAPFSLNNGASIDLAADWHKTDGGAMSPPSLIGSYAPPFHFTNALVASNDQQEAMLELATSDNPLAGHDSYWLDAQMHSPPGSGMSLTDFLFYLFLPPSQSCLGHMFEVYTEASRAPQSGDPSSQSDLQVSATCTFTASLSDFYSSQISSAITFEQTAGGPRAFPDVKDFQLTPMEQVDVSGLTFFVFEAQSTQGISADAVAHFNLPKELQGAHADFFWAIGAESPFPFVRDPGRKDAPVIHLSYASIAPGPNPNRRPDFMDLLHHVHFNPPPQ